MVYLIKSPRGCDSERCGKRVYNRAVTDSLDQKNEKKCVFDYNTFRRKEFPQIVI